MGYCLFRMRDFDGAKKAYNEALGHNWRLPRAHAGLGSICMLQYLEDSSKVDFREKAIEHWHRSLELDPDQPRIRKLLVRYRPSTRDPEESLLGAPGQGR